MISPERWQRAKDVFSDALNRPTAERGAFIERACGDDAEVRAEVESLLAAARSMDDSDALPVALPDAEIALLESALRDRYEILHPLGHGGMGAVYLARERELDRLVAIKVLHANLAASPQSRERFRREARVAAQIAHPGIVSLYSFGEVRGIWYFVMSYVRGSTLAERLRLEGRLNWRDALGILIELTDALDFAHHRGVIHRDIKPANILLEEETGRTMLADFGIAKLHGADAGESLTASGAIVGTPQYMSPEQATASVVDERSDIYSLGAVAYTMLGGREPYEGASVPELILRKLRADPPPLQSLAAAVPVELSEIVMRCLARDPALRWPTARALGNALRRIRGDGALAGALPSAIRNLPTFGPYAMAWAVFWIIKALFVDDLGDRALLVLVAVIVPLGLFIHSWAAVREGYSIAELARVACWPPEWWGMWWPARLRRPNDFYLRLPLPARAVRAVLSFLFALVPGMIIWRAAFPEQLRHATWFAPTELACLIIALVTVGCGAAWVSRFGLTLEEGAQVLFGATTPQTWWETPRMLALLAPPRGSRVRAPERNTPHDHRRAISELLAIPPFAATELASLSRQAAERMTDAMAQADREIVALSKATSHVEVSRLESQLAALEQSGGRTETTQPLRELLRQQLEVLHAMQAQCEALAQRRARRMELLHGLWVQLAREVDAEVASSLTADREAAIRALVLEMERELATPASPRFV